MITSILADFRRRALPAAMVFVAGILTVSGACARDLADSEYAELLNRIYGGRGSAAEAFLDSLAAECAGEPYFLIARARLLLEGVIEDDLDKTTAKEQSKPVLDILQQAIDACDERLARGGDELALRRLRGWAWMVRSQAHAQGRSFYTAGREAGRGKNDLEAYLAVHPEDPVSNGLLGAFLYFSDAVPAVFQMLSKLVFLPTGDRARGLAMINTAEASPGAKHEDFRTLSMTVNVLFEGRWEEGLPQALRLQQDHPAYVRMVLPLSAMRLLAPGMGSELNARIEQSEALATTRPVAEVDTTSLWMNRTYRAWIDRLLRGAEVAEPGFAAIVQAHPLHPDWIADFAERQLKELASDRADGVPDALVAAVWTASSDSLPAIAADLDRLAAAAPRAAFFAAECHLRLGDLATAERLYRGVVTSKGAEHLEPYRMVAATRVGEIKARDGRYRAASRWYQRAGDHHRDVYRVDWMLEGRARHFDEMGRDGGRMAQPPVLFARPR